MTKSNAIIILSLVLMFAQTLYASPSTGICEVGSTQVGHLDTTPKAVTRYLEFYPDATSCWSLVEAFCLGRVTAYKTSMGKKLKGRPSIDNQNFGDAEYYDAGKFQTWHRAYCIPSGDYKNPEDLYDPKLWPSPSSYVWEKSPYPNPAPNRAPKPISPGPGSGLLYRDVKPPVVYVPLPVGGTILVPVKPGTPTGDFIIEVSRILSEAGPIVVGLILVALTVAGVIAAVGALGSVETGGLSLVLSIGAIKAAGVAIIAICTTWGISVNKNALSPSASTAYKYDTNHAIPKDTNFLIEKSPESQFRVYANDSCAMISFPEEYATDESDIEVYKNCM